MPAAFFRVPGGDFDEFRGADAEAGGGGEIGGLYSMIDRLGKGCSLVALTSATFPGRAERWSSETSSAAPSFTMATSWAKSASSPSADGLSMDKRNAGSVTLKVVAWISMVVEFGGTPAPKPSVVVRKINDRTGRYFILVRVGKE